MEHMSNTCLVTRQHTHLFCCSSSWNIIVNQNKVEQIFSPAGGHVIVVGVVSHAHIQILKCY